MSDHSSDVFCCRMNPSSCLLASVLKRVGLAMSKNDKTSGLVRDFFATENASSWLLDHTKSFLVLSSGLRGARSVASVFALVDNWLTKLMNDHNSVRLVGVGYLEIASVMDSSIWYPLTESWKPAKVT